MSNTPSSVPIASADRGLSSGSLGGATHAETSQGEAITVKSGKEAMEILAAYDLTKSYRAAAELAGCSHHTVARLVAERDSADQPAPPREKRPMLIDEFLPKLETWVEDSKGKLRADVAHDKLVALGFSGDERTTRRAVAQVKRVYQLGHTRVHRPWITEPGLWLQYDFGDGPLIDGIKAVLLCAWLAWCRYRVVIPLRDRTAPSVYAGLDRVFREIGGVPTYLLTENVPRNIFGVMSPPSLCAGPAVVPSRTPMPQWFDERHRLASAS
jgi:hypothetical protein